MDVGVIGLGTMGGRMASALVRGGHRVVAHDVSADALRRAVAEGAHAATSSAEVGTAVRIVLLSLPAPAHVEAAVAGDDGLLARPRDGLVIVDTTTVDPGTTRRLASRANLAGVGYLDAPVLGRPESCGTWTFPVGGDRAALDIARPVLDVLGSTVVHVGEPGTGNAVKLLNNLMFGAINAITAEVMAACALVGVSPRTFYETVAGSEAATVSPLFRALGPKMLDGDYSPVFTVDLLHKDTSLAMAMLDEAKASLIVGGAALVLTSLARAAGHGGLDSSAVVKVYEALLGVEVAEGE